MAPSWADPFPALKLFISDLINVPQRNGIWAIHFAENRPAHPVHSLQIQVEVVKLSGMENEVMLVTDGTGKAKVTKGPNVPGEFSWLKNGSKVSVVGTILDSGKIPHIQATKIASVDNQAQIDMWPLEVRELRSYFSDTRIPNVMM